MTFKVIRGHLKPRGSTENIRNRPNTYSVLRRLRATATDWLKIVSAVFIPHQSRFASDLPH